MLGLEKLKEKRDEKKRKKEKLTQIVINACVWFVCVFLFLFPLIYGINIGTILITLIAIAGLPIEPIRNLWKTVFKNKFTPLIKGGILFVLFIVATQFLPIEDTITTEPNNTEIVYDSENSEINSEIDDVIAGNTESESESNKPSESESESEIQKPSTPTQLPTKPSVTVSSVPAYSGKSYVALNNNKPSFDTNDLSPVSYEYYSNLDSLGRCGVVYACIGQDIMPTEERGSIGSVKPTGWHTVKYNGVVDGNYLYNRCHLIGFQLTGENANEKNLITGTRQMNVEGMLPFENMVADYIKETNNHVMYRVTPIFDGKNLLATGVQMEAWSIEDNGKGICFNVFVYNVQDGININYANGDSSLIETQPSESETPAPTPTPTPQPTPEPEPEPEPDDDNSNSGKYAVNKKNGKIHIVGECSATGTGDNAMTDVAYFDTYEEALAYSKQIAPNQKKPDCGNCWR